LSIRAISPSSTVFGAASLGICEAKRPRRRRELGDRRLPNAAQEGRVAIRVDGVGLGGRRRRTRSGDVPSAAHHDAQRLAVRSKCSRGIAAEVNQQGSTPRCSAFAKRRGGAGVPTSSRRPG
jgi:hypothetical protein